MEWLSTASWSEIDGLWKKVYQNGFQTIPLPEPHASHVSPCLVSNYRSDTRGNKQVCIGRGSRKKHIIVHQLSYVYHNRERIPTDKTVEVSHTCNRHECCEPTHILLESRKANHSRKNCIGYVWSSKYNDWIEVCDHEKICLTAKKRKLDVNTK